MRYKGWRFPSAQRLQQVLHEKQLWDDEAICYTGYEATWALWKEEHDLLIAEQRPKASCDGARAQPRAAAAPPPDLLPTALLQSATAAVGRGRWAGLRRHRPCYTHGGWPKHTTRMANRVLRRTKLLTAQPARSHMPRRCAAAIGAALPRQGTALQGGREGNNEAGKGRDLETAQSAASGPLQRQQAAADSRWQHEGTSSRSPETAVTRTLGAGAGAPAGSVPQALLPGHLACPPAWLRHPPSLHFQGAERAGALCGCHAEQPKRPPYCIASTPHQQKGFEAGLTRTMWPCGAAARPSNWLRSSGGCKQGEIEPSKPDVHAQQCSLYANLPLAAGHHQQR